MSANRKGCRARAWRSAKAMRNKAASAEDGYRRFAKRVEF